MQTNQNQNLNQSTNTNYARLADDLPPYQPVIIDDTQPHYGQPVYNPGYNQPYAQNQPIGYNPPYAQNQGFNNQPYQNQIYQNQGYQNQGFSNDNLNNALHMRCASLLRCLCLTVIIQNLIYLIFDIVYNGFYLSFVFFFMIFEGILFGYYMSKIKNGLVSLPQFNQVRKAFITSCVIYSIYFVIISIIAIAVINNVDPDIDPTAVVIILIVSSLIFLLPRFIALCVTRKVDTRPVLVVANQ